MGEAGIRIRELFCKMKKANQKEFFISRFDDFLEITLRETIKGAMCLLSPAAASYNEFPNFETRGKRFKELVTGGLNEVSGK